MASEYNLALKATLDTSQVRQELQRLKYSYTVGSDDGNSFSKGAPGAAHMQKIEVQLTRLGQSISSLQRAIEQLTRSETRAASSGNSHPVVNNQSTLPVVPQKAFSGKANWKDWLDSKDYRKFNNYVKSTIAEKFDATEQQFLMYRTGVSSAKDPLFAHKLLSSQYGKGLFGSSFNYEKEVAQYQAKQQAAQQEAMKRQQASMRQNRQMAAMIGGQLFGGAANILGNLGYTDTSNFLDAMGSGLTAGGGAAMTASMMGAGSAAGPIGILAGLATVFSSLYSSALDASAAIQKMAEEIDEVFKTLHQDTLNDQRSVQETRHQINADMFERTGNMEQARKLAEYWKENSQYLQKQFADSNPLAEERKIKERGEARKRNVDKAMQEGDVSWLDNSLASFLMHLGGDLNVQEKAQKAKNEVDKQTAKQIEEMQRKYAAMQQDLTSAQKIQTMYQGVVDKLEDKQKSEQRKESAKEAAEVATRLKLNEANDAAIFGYKTRSQLNQTQAFVDGVLGNKSIGALDKFSAIAAELDAARSQKNSALSSAFEIAKYLKQNEATLDSTELQINQRKQSQYDKEAAAAEARIGILENALTDIQTSTLAPDLSHVTSLAQYGFNMGEKDDNAARIEKYYSKSLNLQQQIKDKLQEGVKTEAVYN